MLTRPFYKKMLGLFGLAAAAQASPAVKQVSEFPLSEPQEVKRIRACSTRATKGAFGKCRYRFDTHRVTDPAFNHSLRRKA